MFFVRSLQRVLKLKHELSTVYVDTSGTKHLDYSKALCAQAQIDMAQEGKLQNSHIKFKNPKQVQPTSIPQTQAIELLDINVLDKKGKPKVITYDNVEKHIDKY